MSKHIIVRNLKFKTTPQTVSESLAIDPIAVAFFSALSATFPHGEAFFVQSVAHFSKQVSPALKVEVDAFVRQEALHLREHVTFNNALDGAGLPMETLILRSVTQLGKLSNRSPYYCLAITVALEHFTSIFAEKILTDPRHLAHYVGQELALWKWHAVEEIEHKAVAMDMFNHVTAQWTPQKRWAYRAVAMTDCLLRLGYVVSVGFGDVLASKGLATKGWRGRVAHYLFVRPGLLSAMLPSIIRFFRPGFHPNQTDERELLATAREFSDLAVR